MFKNIGEIRKANAKLGHFWFSRVNMEFHGTEFHGGVVAGQYFIASGYGPTTIGIRALCPGGERAFNHGPTGNETVYSVYEAKPDGEIETVAGALGSLDEAKEALGSLWRPSFTKRRI